MKTLIVTLPGREYSIQIGRGLLTRAGEELRAVLPGASRLFVVTDSHVAPLYLERVRASLERTGFRVAAYTVPAGESSKCVARLAEPWEVVTDVGLTRADAVAALGDGVVGNLAGFAVAAILRGMDLVQIPTTLLAQMSSSVGSRVAVDLEYGKNLVRAFWRPRLVLVDPEILGTLPLPIFMEDIMKVVRYGCIRDATFFDFLATRPSRAELMAEMERILYAYYAIKRSVMEQDERGTEERMLFNFGHTLGHAYKLTGHYTEWNHDAAVAAGMHAAARLSVRLGVTPAELPERLEEAFSASGLPTTIPCMAEDYAAAMGLDKKGVGGDVSVILLERMGHAVPHRMPKPRLLKELR